ncbi:type II toxin-antitoxin system prevent-host-death family antitoxin [Yinghuangia sp. ASG 101]|uniref:type II toxin-antitoxin system Phd/YefM family antitoxin n=1 Tax=Yinghuangia sp. ASG 101 TaxID=2896848 RepID=UPI001E62501B|nr:type II toxin-antitoxin system prevent-host-death family antitoxin [Yinghuangia sp. ASG 101]UGQ14200.1 type II toxin-antitoxin system prevent-host-death family antitoxin [Yinghuangia sp. ASG 101]
MNSEPVNHPVEIPVSEARPRLAELVDDAAHGRVVYLTRHGRRVAAIVPADLPEKAGDVQVRALARQFAERHPDLLDRLRDA